VPLIEGCDQVSSNLRSKILEKRGVVPSKLIHIDEWSLDVEVRSMDGNARLSMTEKYGSNQDAIDLKSMYLDLVVNCTFDPAQNTKVFEDEDREAILDLSGSALEAIAQAALDVSGMAGEAGLAESGKDLS
jgi:hypothetical protein